MNLNGKETFTLLVPSSDHTADAKGGNEIRGDNVDHKRGITSFSCGARTGEEAGVQLIYKVKQRNENHHHLQCLLVGYQIIRSLE